MYIRVIGLLANANKCLTRPRFELLDDLFLISQSHRQKGTLATHDAREPPSKPSKGEPTSNSHFVHLTRGDDLRQSGVISLRRRQWTDYERTQKQRGKLWTGSRQAKIKMEREIA